MIEEKDIELLVKAKGDRFAIDVLMVLSTLNLCVLIFIEANGIMRDYNILLATCSLVFSVAALGRSRGVRVSRDDLLKVLERVIHTDPDTLRILATKNRRQVCAFRFTQNK